MCGRFTLRAPASVVAEQFALFETAAFGPRYNIAPSQPVPVVRLASGRAPPARELAWPAWGLVPSWAKDPAIGNRLINARAETVAEKPAFRGAFRQRRCLVAADGFYEWQAAGRQRQPYFFHRRDDRPFAFAGLWEAWEGPDHAVRETCTLLTTAADDLMRPIHDRRPLILAPGDYAAWLDPASPPQRLAALLLSAADAELEVYPVSTLVNNPRHDSPQCIERERRLPMH